MRKGICLLLLACLTIPVFAEDEEEQTLFSGDVTHGGFGGPAVRLTKVKDEFGLLVGGRGGWIINHTLCIGGGGYGLVNYIPVDPLMDESEIPLKDPVLGMGYGGFEMEYVHNSSRLVHSTFNLFVGVGGVGIRERQDGIGEWEHDDHHMNWDSFFIVEPEFNAELNVTSFFRLNAGASYRFVSGVDKYGLTNADIGGPSVVLMFKFGKF